ncbi:hypothetical protein DPSP01_006994 [Paraphaeosphaeria sporulosa]
MTSRFPTPAELASFPKPNYVNPITRQPLIIGVTTAMSVMVIALLACRIYSRTVLVYAVGWDDWIMLSAGVIAVANNILVTISTSKKYQMGYHIWDIRLEQLLGTLEAGKFGMAIQLLFIVTIGLTKVSILMTYLRIFPTKVNKRFCYIMLTYTIAFSIACFFLVLFQCTPVRVYWETYKFLLTVKQHCKNVKVIYFFWSAQNTLSDFFIFLWPVKDIASVRISRRQRITLISMFSCGLIVCVAGSARIYYTHLYLYSYDVLWWGATVFAVMSIETCLGIVCGCLPGCKPLMSRLFPQVFGTPSNRSNSGPARYPRQVKEILSSNDSRTLQGTEASFQLQSLNSGGKGMVIPPDAKRFEWSGREEREVEVTIPRRPGQAMFRSEKQNSAWRTPCDREFHGNGNDSNGSQEFIILQRQSRTSMQSIYGSEAGQEKRVDY